MVCTTAVFGAVRPILDPVVHFRFQPHGLSADGLDTQVTSIASVTPSDQDWGPANDETPQGGSVHGGR